MKLFGPDADAIFDRSAPDGPRHQARRPLGLAELRSVSETRTEDVFKDKGLAARQLLNQLAYVAICMLRFADLVVMAGRLHPFPFRTRP